MVETASTMTPLGQSAPDFSLQDAVSGNTVCLEDVRGSAATVVMFICNHCPYVIHVRDQLVSLANDYRNKGVGFVAISSNDAVNYPDDAPDKMAHIAKQCGFTFPYLYDESQDVARAYGAACTPDFFAYDAQLKLVYRGQLDDARPGSSKPADGSDLRAALESLLSGDPIREPQKPSVGCNIKWKR